MIRFLVPAATAALTAAFASGWFIAASLYPAKPPVLADELRDQVWMPPSVHDRDVIRRNTEFNAARSVIRHYHPDVPRTIDFPEIATNPVLWDFTLHSVLRGERRTWTWGYTRYGAVAPTITTAGTGAVYPTTAGTITTGTTVATGNGPSITWAGACHQGAYSQTFIIPSIIPAASGGPP